jgi:hypothetical protein
MMVTMMITITMIIIMMINDCDDGDKNNDYDHDNGEYDNYSNRITVKRNRKIQISHVKRDCFLWQVRFLSQITQNHANEKNTMIHELLYLHHLRDFE